MERLGYRPLDTVYKEYQESQDLKPEYWINPKTNTLSQNATINLDISNSPTETNPIVFNNIHEWWATFYNPRTGAYNLEMMPELVENLSTEGGNLIPEFLRLVDAKVIVIDSIHKYLIKNREPFEREQLRIYLQTLNKYRENKLSWFKKRKKRIPIKKKLTNFLFPRKKVSPHYEFQGSNDYAKNRKRICELYGIDPKKASVHHIVFRSDIKNGGFENSPESVTVNNLANLYPFSEENGSQTHTSFQDHVQLHRKAFEMEKEEPFPSKPKSRARKEKRLKKEQDKRERQTLYVNPNNSEQKDTIPNETFPQLHSSISPSNSNTPIEKQAKIHPNSRRKERELRRIKIRTDRRKSKQELSLMIDK